MPGFVGMPELLLLALVALILFGPKKLPEMGRGLGKGLREFKDSVSGDHKEQHGFDESKLELPHEMTSTPTGPEAVTTDVAAEPVTVAPVAVEKSRRSRSGDALAAPPRARAS